MLEGRIYENPQQWPIFTPIEASGLFAIHFNRTSGLILCTSKTLIMMSKKNQNSEASITICYHIKKLGHFNHGQRTVKMLVSILVNSDPNNSSAKEISPSRSSVKICYKIEKLKNNNQTLRLKPDY